MTKSVVIYDKWLSTLGGGEVVAGSIAAYYLKQGWQVTVVGGDQISLAQINKRLHLDLTGINLEFLWNDQNRLAQLTNHKDLFFNVSYCDGLVGAAKKNYYYAFFPTPVELSWRIKFLFLIPGFTNATNIKLLSHFRRFKRLDNLLMKAKVGNYVHFDTKLPHYQNIFTCSKYSASWIKKYWRRNSTVIYPPINLLTSKLKKAKLVKEKIILNVGRFFIAGHGKKQEVLIEAFKQFYDQGHPDWQLHLAGGVNEEKQNREYFYQLQQSTHGYPIFFHPNCTTAQLEELYLRASIYWHAAGYGEDPQVNPNNFEHLGITPIEAISAGCVPILFAGGGLVETIKINGLPSWCLFQTIDELIANTHTAINTHYAITFKTLASLEQHYGQLQFEHALAKLI